jgi:1,2-diacylglycerol 3-beta-galactosyltransferase
MMRKLELIFLDAGGGHRGAADALSAVINRQGRFWQVRMSNLQDVLESRDVCRTTPGVRLHDIYDLMLEKGWTNGSSQLAAAVRMLMRLTHTTQVKLLESFLHECRPDLVISFVPHFNRALCDSLGRVLPATPLVTILTDLADHPPHFCSERQSQYLICGSARAVAQAREFGHPVSHIFRTSGVIVHPRFYEHLELDRRAERKKLGLDPERPTGLVMFGSEGSEVMLEIVDRMEQGRAGAQLIMICGRNQQLASRLRAFNGRMPICVEGYTTDMPYYMRLSDFFIGKPGPGGISEALVAKLPVIVEDTSRTMPQDRYNMRWIRDEQVGLVVRHFRDIDGAVEELLKPRNYTHCKSMIAIQENRAVFEIPPILEEIQKRCEEELLHQLRPRIFVERSLPCNSKAK